MSSSTSPRNGVSHQFTPMAKTPSTADSTSGKPLPWKCADAVDVDRRGIRRPRRTRHGSTRRSAGSAPCRRHTTACPTRPSSSRRRRRDRAARGSPTTRGLAAAKNAVVYGVSSSGRSHMLTAYDEPRTSPSGRRTPDAPSRCSALPVDAVRGERRGAAGRVDAALPSEWPGSARRWRRRGRPRTTRIRRARPACGRARPVRTETVCETLPFVIVAVRVTCASGWPIPGRVTTPVGLRRSRVPTRTTRSACRRVPVIGQLQVGGHRGRVAEVEGRRHRGDRLLRGAARRVEAAPQRDALGRDDAQARATSSSSAASQVGTTTPS